MKKRSRPFEGKSEPNEVQREARYLTNEDNNCRIKSVNGIVQASQQQHRIKNGEEFNIILVDSLSKTEERRQSDMQKETKKKNQPEHEGRHRLGPERALIA